MTSPADGVLAGATVDPAVLALRPDHRALLLTVEGLEPGPSDAVGEALLVRAETATRELLAAGPVEEVPHVAAWREAYRAFGATPQRTRNSAEALLRRAAVGLPRVTNAGMTCRPWNQAAAPGSPKQPRAQFVLDALDPLTDAALAVDAGELVEHLTRLGPDVRVARQELSRART